MIRKLFSFYFCILLVAFFNAATHADELPDDYFDEGFGVAMGKWLKIEGDKYPSALYESTFYANGFAIALDDLLSKEKWVVHKVVNDSYPDGLVAKGKDDVQIAQAPFRTKLLCTYCSFFISRENDLDKTLIVSISGGTYITINHSMKGNQFDDSDTGLTLATEFSQDIKEALKSGLVYKNGVLNFENGVVGFLQGIDEVNVTWDTFVFPAESKGKMIEAVDGFVNNFDSQTSSEYGLPKNRGILLYGPPGTGKSFVAKIIASNILHKRYSKKISYIHVSARHIYNTDSVREVYQIARDLAPAIIFFEDVDLIAGTDRNDRADIKNELMQQLSGLESQVGVMTIGTTNVKERIDAALLRSQRLGFQFEIGLPKSEERLELYKIYLKKSDYNAVTLGTWVDKVEGYSGADIKELCEIAIELAVTEGSWSEEENKKPLVTDVHMEEAYKQKFIFKVNRKK